MANQERKRRQEPDVHQPIKEPGQKKHTVKPGQKTSAPEESKLESGRSRERRS